MATEAEAGQTVNLTPGQKLVLRLPSNPTTGYAWHLGHVESSVLHIAAAPAFEPATSGMVGAGGVEVFTFTAQQPGETVLTLNYARSWETNQPPAKNFNLKAIVK
jgi:inhibitor of cysteine peptidase